MSGSEPRSPAGAGAGACAEGTRRGRAGTRRWFGFLPGPGGAGAGVGCGMSAGGRGQRGFPQSGSAARRALPAVTVSGTFASALPSSLPSGAGRERGRCEAEDGGGPGGNGFAGKSRALCPGENPPAAPGAAAGQGSGQSPRRVTRGQEKSGQQNLSWNLGDAARLKGISFVCHLVVSKCLALWSRWLRRKRFQAKMP